MKKVLIALLLIASLVSTTFADIRAKITLSNDCKKFYTNDISKEVTVTVYQTDELYNKVMEISKKYFPKEDTSKIILVGWDSDGSLNDRHLYAFTFGGSLNLKDETRYGQIIHLSTQNLPGKINDPNFEWVILHELIHAYTVSDVTHSNPECKRMAEDIKSKYGIDVHYR